MLKVQSREPWSRLYPAAWYAACLGVLLLLPLWKFDSPLWNLPSSKLIPFMSLAAAFVVSSGAALLLPSLHRWRDLGFMILVTMATFCIVFFGFIVTKTEFSRATTITAFLCAIGLIPLPYLIGASAKKRIVAFLVLLLAGLSTPFLPSMLPRQLHTSALIKTEYYNLEVETYSGVFPRSSILGGGLARIGDRYLRLSGDGHLYLFGWDSKSNKLVVNSLPYRVPINGDEFAIAAGHPWQTPRPGEVSENENAVSGSNYLHTESFRTYGLLTQEIGARIRIFVSHDYWKADQSCWVERISLLDADRATVMLGVNGPQWTTLYETAPCLPIRGEGSRRGMSFLGQFGGGRMALSDPQTLLLTVGDFDFNGIASSAVLAQDPNVSYGKTIAINTADGRSTLFTLGHRNPQGLVIDHSGTIWSTEHGPQGGDELNHLERGKNYGWPYVTYGTDYGSFSWPLSRADASQNFQAPVFAWVPSIGVSNLLEVEGDLFPQWRDDLLIGSLRAQTLFRARVRGGRVVYLEPIELGSRIRDLVEGLDGRIVIVTDAEVLDSIRPKDGGSGEALFAEKCSGCHDINQSGNQKMGPNLTGVLGRKVATLESYHRYSSALRSLDGVWTEARLAQFINSPHEFSPGTAMEFSGDTDPKERSAIIHYLQTQH